MTCVTVCAGVATTMVPSISEPGSGFRGVLDYDLKPSKEPELLGGNMRAETARGLAAEFGDWRALNENVGKPVFHASLSAAPEDKISAARWLEIAGVFVERMGYGNSPWVAIRHHDRPSDHIHVVACRIDNQGRYVPNHLEKKRSQEVCREIETDFGLRQLRSPERATPTRDQVAAFERTGSVTVKARLQEHIDVAARDRPTMGEFIQRLEAQGIEVRANIAATGHVSGVSFAYDGVACKGSDLGRGYSWRQLQERAGIAYQPARDLPILRAAADRATTCIATKKPLVRDAAAPSMPALARPAKAFREAAILESRAEVEERHGQLLHELGKWRAVAAGAHRETEQGPFLERDVATRRSALERALAQVYDNPTAAWRRMADAYARDGLEKTATTLERHPTELGRLHGHALGQFETQTRREARAAAPWAGRELRGLIAAHASAEEHRARAATVAKTLDTSAWRAENVLAKIRRLPDLDPIRQELLRAGRELGTAVVKALSARAAGVFTATARLLGRTLGHGLSRGFGRDDDGLGLGR
jgi:hypothetical protein